MPKRRCMSLGHYLSVVLLILPVIPCWRCAFSLHRRNRCGCQEMRSSKKKVSNKMETKKKKTYQMPKRRHMTSLGHFPAASLSSVVPK